MSGMSDAITLKYWNGRGLMEVPRIMMAMAGKCVFVLVRLASFVLCVCVFG